MRVYCPQDLKMFTAVTVHKTLHKLSEPFSQNQKSFLFKMPVKTIFGQNNDPIHKWMEEE